MKFGFGHVPVTLNHPELVNIIDGDELHSEESGNLVGLPQLFYSNMGSPNQGILKKQRSILPSS